MTEIKATVLRLVQFGHFPYLNVSELLRNFIALI